MSVDYIIEEETIKKIDLQLEGSFQSLIKELIREFQQKVEKIKNSKRESLRLLKIRTSKMY